MCIERSFGLLKRRFPALKLEVRIKNPTEICKMIQSAFILHNICIDERDEDNFLSENEMEENEEEVTVDDTHPIGRAVDIRNNLASLL